MTNQLQAIFEYDRLIQTKICESAHEVLRVRAAKDETSIGVAISKIVLEFAEMKAEAANV